MIELKASLLKLKWRSKMKTNNKKSVKVLYIFDKNNPKIPNSLEGLDFDIVVIDEYIRKTDIKKYKKLLNSTAPLLKQDGSMVVLNDNK